MQTWMTCWIEVLLLSANKVPDAPSLRIAEVWGEPKKPAQDDVSVTEQSVAKVVYILVEGIMNTLY